MYNSAAVRKQEQPGWKQRAFEIQKNFWVSSNEVSFNEQLKTTARLKTRLQDIRNEIDRSIKQIPVGDFEGNTDLYFNEFSSSMQALSSDCSSAMIGYAGEIIEESVKLLQKSPPCSFSALAIGSMAKGEATPYSDLEYIFLIEKRSLPIEQYFEKLAVTSYFLIGNLGETTLKYMDIKELKGWFQDCAVSGFKIDGLAEEAGNIPTGNGYPGTQNQFIVTVKELSSMYGNVLNTPEKEKALKGDLTAMFSFTEPIFNYNKDKGNVSMQLYNNFLRSIEKIHVGKERQEINIEMLRADTTKFNFTPDEKVHARGFTVDVKKELYRFPSILLLDLAIVFQCIGKSSWETADKLVSEGHISEYLHQSLRFMLSCACYIRLCAYLFHRSHNDSVSVLPKSVTLQKESNQSGMSKHHQKWFIPGRLYMMFCEVSMPIKQSISTFLDKSQQSQFCHSVGFVKSLGFTEIPTSVRFLMLYSAGRYMDALKIIASNEDTASANPASILSRLDVGANHRRVLKPVVDVFLRCSRFTDAVVFASYVDSNYPSILCKVDLARCYNKLGEYDRAVEVLSSAYNDTSKEADRLLELAHAYSMLGDLEGAEEMVIQALQMYYNEASDEKFYDYYGEEIPGTMSTVNFQDVKLDLIKCTPEMRLRLVRYSSPSIIDCFERLSYIYWKRNNHDLDKSYSDKITEMLAQVFGQSALVRMRAQHLNSVAVQHSGIGQNKQSEKFYLDLLSIYEEMYGNNANHIDIANVLYNMSCLYINTKDYQKAQQYSMTSLKMLRETYGEESTHDDILNVISIIGELYKLQGEHKLAKEWYLKFWQFGLH